MFGGAPSLSRFVRQGGDFDFGEPDDLHDFSVVPAGLVPFF
jgi:hypothetical protein